MKCYTALFACLCLVLQPVMALAEMDSSPIAGADTRLYLADGSLVEGNLVEKGQELVIMRCQRQDLHLRQDRNRQNYHPRIAGRGVPKRSR